MLMFAVSDSEYEAVQFLFLHLSLSPRPSVWFLLVFPYFCHCKCESLLALFFRNAFCTLGFRWSSVKRLVWSRWIKLCTCFESLICVSLPEVTYLPSFAFLCCHCLHYLHHLGGYDVRWQFFADSCSRKLALLDFLVASHSFAFCLSLSLSVYLYKYIYYFFILKSLL